MDCGITGACTLKTTEGPSAGASFLQVTLCSHYTKSILLMKRRIVGLILCACQASDSSDPMHPGRSKASFIGIS
jgi:hypothetical protein